MFTLPHEERDQETDDILKEMEEEGEDVSPIKSIIEPSEKPAESESEEEPEEEEEEKGSESESEEEKSEEESSEEEESEEESEAEEEEEELETTDTFPKGQSVPLSKHLKLQNKLKVLQTEVAELRKKGGEKSEVKIDEEIDKFVKDNKLEDSQKSVIKGILDLGAKLNQPDPAIARLLERAREEEFWENQENQFDAEFEKNVLPLIQRDNPNATQEDVDRVYNALTEAAWNPDTAKKSLVNLYLSDKNLQPKKNRTTGETSRRSHLPPGKNIEDLTPEDIDEMSDQEFDKFSDRMQKQSGGLVKSNLNRPR